MSATAPTSKILTAVTHYPPHIYHQPTIAKLLHRYCTHRLDTHTNLNTSDKQYCRKFIDKIPSIFNSTKIAQRHFLLPPHRLFQAVSIDTGDGTDGVAMCEQNIRHTKKALLKQMTEAIDLTCQQTNISTTDINCLITTTGIYTVPPIDMDLLNAYRFAPGVHRLHLAGAASGGGARVLIEAHNYLQLHPSHCVMTVCGESGSHGWLGAIRQQVDEILHDRHNGKVRTVELLNEIVVSAIMGDGVACCIVVGAQHPLAQSPASPHAMTIRATMSTYLPRTQHVIQRVNTPFGFHTRLDSRLPTLVVPPLSKHLLEFISRNQLAVKDMGFYVMHPGGSKVLQLIEEGFNVPHCEGTPPPSSPPTLTHSWQSMQNAGNCSSVSVIDVLKRTMADKSATGNGLLFAVGPGIVGEALLLHR